MSNSQNETLDDEFEYHAYRLGRPTRTKEVQSADGTTTIEEGTLTFELVHRSELWETRESDGWIAHYVAPDGGMGFGIGEGNSGGVVVSYDLAGIIEFPEPMTEKEADGWLEENRDQWEPLLDEQIESDITAEDILEEIR